MMVVGHNVVEKHLEEWSGIPCDTVLESWTTVKAPWGIMCT